MLHSYEKYVGRLQGEYLEAFKKIEMYFKSNEIFIFYDDVDEAISEILDMLLMAQEESKPIDKVVGNDMKEFCRRYVKEAYIRKAVKYINNQYNSVNKKRTSRGKAEISRREFINKKIKDQVITRYITPVMIAVILCEVMYFLCIRGLHNIFSVSSLILILIMIVIVLFLIDYIFKFKVYKEIIKSLREDNQ